MSDSILISATTNGPTNSAVRFGNIYGFPEGDWGSTEAPRHMVVSASGTLSKFRVSCATAPGAGNTWTYTVRLNGADTALLVTLGEAETSDQNTSDTVAVVAGDFIDIEATPASSPVLPGVIRFSTVFSSTTAGESMLFANTPPTAVTTTTKYLCLGGAINGGTATETLANIVIPFDATVKNLVVKCSVAPGGVQTRTITVRKNEATTLLLVLITGAATTGSDLGVNLVDVAPGDRICVECVASATAASSQISVGVTLLADTVGQFIISASASASFTNGAVGYNSLCAGWSLFDATEANEQGVSDAMTVSAIYVQLSGTPGAGKSYTFDLRKNASSPGLSVAIADTATTGSTTGASISIAAGDLVCTSITPAGTPTLRTGMVSYLASISAPPASTVKPFTMLGVG